MRHFCHIIGLVEFRRIDFVHLVLVHLALLSKMSVLSLETHGVTLTLPSSHCTRRLSPSSSSTTQPRIKAVFGSFNQTYLLPEKSFSPSIPRTTSALLCISSDVIKVGAKVPVAGVLLRCELDRIRVEPLRDGAGPDVSGEKDWLRWCPTAGEGESGDDISIDFGRPLLGEVTGEGDVELLLNGFDLHLGPLWAGAVISGGPEGVNRG